MTPFETAVAAQRRAARPDASAWVSANAGSGKTRVLTNRIVRLMLAGAEPDRILSLTFTKAAAAEMSNRLFGMLSDWATTADDRLRVNLAELIGAEAADEVDLDAARRLFARALDTPGGLKIQTIHAFSEAVLGRFPLEAGISPDLRVIDETESAAMIAAIRERLLAGESGGPEVADAVALLLDSIADTTFDDLLATTIAQRARIEAALQAHGGAAGLARALRRALTLGPAETEATVIATGCRHGAFDELGLRRVITSLRADGGKTALDRAERLEAWVLADDAGRVARFDDHLSVFLTQAGEARTKLYPAKARKADPAGETVLETEQERVLLLQDRRKAARLADMTSALMCIAGALLDDYETAKRRLGRLDFQDLVLKVRDLLARDPGWVLYKLDRGIAHILIDEAQDTAPAQWEIAERLSAEFFSGQGAVEEIRTIFAVGDEKQSIYSFQGADPDGFRRMRAKFRDFTEAVGNRFEDVALELSFRSAPQVLGSVDAVFTGARSAGVGGDATVRHFAHRDEVPGVVELWPLEEPDAQEEANRWDAPLNMETTGSPRRRLAQRIATRIRRMIDEGETIGGGNRPERPVTAGDILVLMRRREPLVGEIARALKDLGIPVAGADRMMLTEQIAVMDLMVLGDFLLLPEDDLALATVLKSPLFDLTDQDLIALAHGRSGTLWGALQARAGEQPPWQAALDELRDLRGQVDRMTPFAFYAALLGAGGARRRLIARLGPDQLDPLDEFLEAALADEHDAPPSLQGFLHRLRRASPEIKRDMDHGGNAVRIMTTHGAKGLEAPVVFLPDTARPPKTGDSLAWLKDGIPVLAAAQKDMPDTVAARTADAAEAALEEYRRLLYVAMTRAEDRLFVCGYFTSPRSAPADDGWYRMVEAGLTEAGAVEAEDGILRLGSPPPAGTATAPVEHRPTLPDWAMQRAPDEPEPSRPLSPSRPAAEPAVRSPLARDPAFGLRRGVLVHRLLQVLPTRPEDARREQGAALLASLAPDLAADQRAALLDEALAVLEMPELAGLFGPGSRAEVPVAGLVGPTAVVGQVDRLAITADSVWIADYKTNRPPPLRVEDVPLAHIRQMALYRAVLQRIHPGHAIRCVLVWTERASVMEVPPARMDDIARSLDAPMAGS
ncbi:MAG: double-strand break repair helicase AddA [Pseudomonadota bacterium]|nr:double-strand break repair helicase AddA [Pseudomonadota bacterium]